MTAPSLAEVLEFSTKVTGYYVELELTKLYEQVCAVPSGGTVVEVGVEYGRSASVYFQVAKHKSLKLNFVDCWVENEADPFRHFMQMIDRNFRNIPFTLWSMQSAAASMLFCGNIDLLHIDACHSSEAVDDDCLNWLPKLNPGGVACFHDYDRKDADGIPQPFFRGVKPAVDKYTSGWDDLGVWDTLAIRKKP